ncbi:OmpA family protein [Acidocella sp.]|uniref:OmpA family protein n=1 Tax=Acidocella sp. TaxID=50710 RepID=UPI00260CEC2E|nr:OmpA family protein [Acidocella sp.]
MKIRWALAAATGLSFPLVTPFVAHAQPVTGPYVALEGGTSLLYPSNAAFTQPIPNTGVLKISGKNQYRPSYAGDLGIGFGFGNGVRVELDGVFSRNTRHALDASFSATSGGRSFSTPTVHMRETGGMNKYGPMFNAIYDIPVAFPVQPYIGAGVGYQWVKLNSHFTTPFGTTTAGTRGSFAYDIIAGVAYNVPAVPGLALTAEYRFTQLTQSMNFKVNFPSGVIVPSGINTRVKFGQLANNTFLVGLRYQIFNPPPAAPVAPVPASAPMAAPAPAPARTFLVFFDWDKADLTPRATQIISEAAADSKTANVTTLQVSGYTDTSGTADYNMGLSERRAKAVAGQLESDGVPASEIEIHAYGETHLLVPTGPGVREPQNRRVEIVLQ